MRGPSGPDPPPSEPNVLLIVVDACRADALGPYGASVFDRRGEPGSDASHRPAETPAAASLAAGGTVFRRAISPAPWTLPSATSLLTGLDPAEHGATSLRYEYDGDRGRRPLQQALSSAGYRTIHLSPKTWIGDWLPQGSGFDRVDEFTGPDHRRFEGGRDVRELSRGVARGPRWYATVIRRALAADAPLRSLGNAAAFKLSEATGDAWLDDVRASERAVRLADERFAEAAANPDGRPFFMYVHLMDPHLPFYVPADHRTDAVRPPGCDDYADERRYLASLMDDLWAIRTGDRRLSPDEVTYLRTRYADEVRYADRAVGRLLDSLNERGLSDRTVVVLTGDHGEHLGERVVASDSRDGAEATERTRDGTERTLLDHQASIRLPLLRVPLVARYPGVFDGGERTDLVQPHYVAETVRALAGLEYDPSRSLLPDDDHRSVARASYEGVVRSHPPDGVPTEKLFRRRRTAVLGRWKLDLVVGDRSGPSESTATTGTVGSAGTGDSARFRASRIDWGANEAETVPLDAIPDDVRTRLEDALGTIDASATDDAESADEGSGGDAAVDRTGSDAGDADERDIPAGVEDRLSQLGYR
ncbi:sulfatase [Halovivax limisalsi]|uniref:sulfatase n=1 Tax=Halovivax limisalsi TaxID=1453760 RepID=UPI001FFDB63B|nr:sulfatase [Halovivax limisalsi]